MGRICRYLLICFGLIAENVCTAAFCGGGRLRVVFAANRQQCFVPCCLFYLFNVVCGLFMPLVETNLHIVIQCITFVSSIRNERYNLKINIKSLKSKKL